MIYVIIQDDVIVNRTVCDDPELAAQQGWVQNDEWQIGWVRDGENFTPEVE